MASICGNHTEDRDPYWKCTVQTELGLEWLFATLSHKREGTNKERIYKIRMQTILCLTEPQLSMIPVWNLQRPP